MVEKIGERNAQRKKEEKEKWSRKPGIAKLEPKELEDGTS